MSALAHSLTGDAEARLLMLHVDDVGMCHGANLAFLELARTGAVTRQGAIASESEMEAFFAKYSMS